MRRTAMIVLLVLLTSGTCVSLISSEPVMAAPSIINVPADYATLQMAINNANVNDTIRVAPGTYKENVLINKTVALMGSGQDQTFVNASSNTMPVFEVQANNVNLSSFTIQGGVIGVSVSGCNSSRILDNRIISNANQGVYFNSSYNNILANNTISLNRYEGVFFHYSNDNIMNGNVVSKNGITGIDFLFSDKNRVSDNTISFHANASLHDQGIWLDTSNNNTFSGNILLDNAYSIEMIDAANNTFYSNIVGFGFHGVELDSSDDNTFYRNNFLNNSLQVSSYRSVNTWDNRSLLEGNYWSDYREKYPGATEVDASGVWNIPYVIDASNNDSYPLVNPWAPPVPDITPPVTTDDYDGLWHNHDFVITLAAADFSGVNETYYKINDASVFSNVTADGQPLITTEGANNTLEYWSVDNVGNLEPHKILTGIKLDKTPPYGSIVINNNDTYAISRLVTLTLFGNDSLSGISAMRFSNDQVDWSLWEGYITVKTWSLSSGDGLKTVYAQFSDNAGLVSQTYSDSIFLDTTPPTLTIVSPLPDSRVRSSQVTVEWFGVEETEIGVGIDHYEVELDGGSWIKVGTAQNYTFTGLSDGDHTVYLRGFDTLGHESEVSVNFVVNTTPLGGPGYFDEAVVVAIVVVVIAVAVFLFWFRKRRVKKPESDLSKKSQS